MAQGDLIISVDYSEVEDATKALSELAEAIERINRLTSMPIIIKAPFPDGGFDELKARLERMQADRKSAAAAKRAKKRQTGANA